MYDLAREVIGIADAGLRARACPGAGGLVPDETHFLNALKDSLESREVPADELIRLYQSEWNHDVTKVFASHSY